MDATKVLQDNGPNWTEFDQTYLLNAALWDGFFLSSLAPWMKTENTVAVIPNHPPYRPDGRDDDDDDDDDDDHDGDEEDAARSRGTPGPESAVAANPNILKPLSAVIDDFVFNGTPLDNPRFSLERSGASDEAIRSALNDYRRTSSVLLNQGAFNVNSTSVAAWKAMLGSIHDSQALVNKVNKTAKTSSLTTISATKFKDNEARISRFRLPASDFWRGETSRCVRPSSLRSR